MVILFLFFAIYCFVKYLLITLWDDKPSNGDYIKITNLPPAKNAPKDKNAYIGMEGVVEDLKEDGSFVLSGETSLLLVGTKYKYEKIR